MTAPQKKPEIATKRLVGTSGCMAKLGGISRNTFYKMIRDNPTFPTPRILQGRRVWLEEEIDSFMLSLPRGEAVPDYAGRL